MKHLIGASLLAIAAVSGPAVGANGFLNIPEMPDAQMPPSVRQQPMEPMQTAPEARGGFTGIPETPLPSSGGGRQGPAGGFNSGAAVAAHVAAGINSFVQLHPDAESKFTTQVAQVYDQELGRVNPRDKFMNLVAVVKNTGTPDPAGRVPYVGAICSIPLTGQAPSCSFTDQAQTMKSVFGKVIPDGVAAQIRQKQPRAAALANGASVSVPKLGRSF